MKIDDTSPPLPRRVSNPRIRNDQALNEFSSNSDKKHRATSASTQALFDYSRLSVFPQSVRKLVQDVELFNAATYLMQHPPKQFGMFQSEERNPETREPEQAHYKRVKISIPLNCRYSQILEKQLFSCYLDGRG